MHIISPIDMIAEVDLLIDAGAKELYGGYLPPEWRDYGLAASLNQRTFEGAQIRTEEELAEIILCCRAQKVTFALTLNAPFYTHTQMPLIIDFVDRMVDIGVDSIILADLGLLKLLKKRHNHLEFQASTLAHLTNSGAVSFMANQGIQRIVLPRHLTVADMAAIAQQHAKLRFDAFLLVGKCPNTEGLCTFHHSSPDKIWPCEIPYEIEPLRAEQSKTLSEAIARQKSWSKTNRRHGCGLCAIPHLKKASITGLKLVGRGAPTKQKVKNIHLTQKFLTLAETCKDFADYQRQAITAHRERFGSACHQNVCYYPEFFCGDVI